MNDINEEIEMSLGTIQILRNQKGGWVGEAKCLRLLTRWVGGWVGVARCLRNQKAKNHTKIE